MSVVTATPFLITVFTLLLFLGGFAASLASVAAVSVTIINFTRSNYSLIVLLVMGTMKLSKEFDTCFKGALKSTSLGNYLTYIGLINLCIQVAVLILVSPLN